MPVISVLAIFLVPMNFTKKVRICLLDSGLDLETDDNTDINLDLNVNTIFPDRIYLKWKDPAWKDPCLPQLGQGGAGKHKCYSIEFRGRLCSDSRRTMYQQELTTEPVTSCLGVPLLLTQKPETKGPTTRSKLREPPSSNNCPSGKLSDSDSDLALEKQRCVKTRSLV